MQPFILTLGGFASLTIAQTMYLTSLLALNPDLSSFADILKIAPRFAGTLNGKNNITILAPTSQAFEALLAGGPSVESQAIKDRNQNAVQALLAYHVMNGTYTSADFTDVPTYVNTILNQSTSLSNTIGTNVTTGQNVGLVMKGGNATILSGVLQSSNVVQADIQTIPNITVHKIDKILTVPLNLSSTLGRLPQLNTSAALGALSTAGLVGESNTRNLDTMEDVTVFIPNSAAFTLVASLFQNATTETLRSVLRYHVIQGSVVFASDITNTTAKTMQGSDLTLSVGTEGTVYVDGARVLVSNVLLSNGVAHVIDGVLNPEATDVARSTLNPTATLGPAFSGASAIGTNVPFTGSAITSVATPSTASSARPQSTAGAGKVREGLGAAIGFGLALVI